MGETRTHEVVFFLIDFSLFVLFLRHSLQRHTNMYVEQNYIKKISNLVGLQISLSMYRNCILCHGVGCKLRLAVCLSSVFVKVFFFCIIERYLIIHSGICYLKLAPQF